MNDVSTLGAGLPFHLNKSDVELYVINALALDRAAEVEEHVACCEACACALAREAQLEMALEMVAERAAHAPVRVAVDAADVTRTRDLRSANAPALDVMDLASARAARRLSATRALRAFAGAAGALAAAAALVLWLTPATRADSGEDVAKYGAVSTDAAGAMVSFDHDTKPSIDKLDGG